MKSHVWVVERKLAGETEWHQWRVEDGWTKSEARRYCRNLDKWYPKNEHRIAKYVREEPK